MEETETLLDELLHCGTATRMSYQEVFEQTLNIDPFSRSIDQCFERVFAQHATEDTQIARSIQTLHELIPLDTAYGPYEIIVVDDNRDTTHNV